MIVYIKNIKKTMTPPRTPEMINLMFLANFP